MVDVSTFGELKDNNSNKKVITKKWCNGKKESGTGKLNLYKVIGFDLPLRLSKLSVSSCVSGIV